ncbi:hypothetical protein MNEG_0991 [Monoraphidium neglectum]|uniref:CARDB domain-containing protein n=1 Tax=Monoraphidium neglectum TaxID=145388 RepID=A0A0D2N3L2_9CHLO|nr:hypothetical protein MNEG_0991 [Monoraphidium neglectum]KIZ06962.1 hypothetical protein MNEG_0991 [Monoraphidium neglectum]|eukprot:XP_013905981.1 hypothetical protein MNEG_0991 [Monoraphidium neglectum]
MTTRSQQPGSGRVALAVVLAAVLAQFAAAQTCYPGAISTPDTNFDVQFSSKVLNTTLSYIKKPKTTYNRYCFNVNAASPCNSSAICCKTNAVTRLSAVSIAIVPTCIVKGLTSNVSLSTPEGANAKSAFGFKINKASKSAAANIKIAPTSATAKSLGSSIVCINLPAAAGLCNTVDKLCGASTCKINVTTTKFKPASLTKPKSLPCCLAGNVNILPAFQADFAVTAIQLIPTSPVAGQPFTARVTVTNTGEIASDPFIVGVYADKAATAACGEAADKTNTTGPIAVGASATVNFGLTAGTVGNKTLRAFSDLFCNLQEKSDVNDQLTLPYTVVAATPGTNTTNPGTNTTTPGTNTTNPGTNTTNPGTNTTNPGNTTVPATLSNLVASALAITGYTGLPATLLPGQTANLTFFVTNAGSAASAATTYALWLNKLVAPVCNDAGATITGAVPALAAGASTPITVPVSLPSTLGALTARLIVDFACSVAESNEADNVAALAYQIAAPVGPTANLVIKSLLADPSLAAGVPLGQLLNLTIEVLNNGTDVSSSAAVVTAFADKLGTPACGEAGDASIPLPALPVGSSANVTLSVPAPLLLGAKTLKVVLDGNCALIESSKADNVGSLLYTVLGADFVLSAAEAVPGVGSLLQINGPFALNLTVTNIGNAAGDPGSLGAFLGITSPAACGSAALNSPSGSSFWGAGPIAPGATATSLFNGFQAAGSAGTYTLWIAVNYMCVIKEPNYANNQLNFTYTLTAPVVG